MAAPTQVELSWAATFVNYEETLYWSIFMDDSRAAVKVKAQVGKPVNGSSSAAQKNTAGL